MKIVRPDMVMCHSGELVWFKKPEQTKLSWQDIDIYLVNLNRYNGGMQWNLAQHLWLCHEMVELYVNPAVLGTGATDQIKKKLVVHDIHEIVVGDMVSGLKPLCPEYRKIEDQWERYFWQFIYPGEPWMDGPLIQAVKAIDQRAVVLESWLHAKPLYQYFVDADPDTAITEEEIELVQNLNTLKPYALDNVKNIIKRYGGHIGS